MIVRAKRKELGEGILQQSQDKFFDRKEVFNLLSINFLLA